MKSTFSKTEILTLSAWSEDEHCLPPCLCLCVSPPLVIGLALSSWLLLPVKLLPGLRLFPPPLLSLILLDPSPTQLPLLTF